MADMLPLAHLMSGFLLAHMMVATGAMQLSGLNLALIALFSLLPDFDALWNRRIASHHQTYFHAPIFWVAVTSAGFQIFPQASIILGFATLFHLLTDFVTGRTIGIPFFYPVKKTEYSLAEGYDATKNLDMLKPEKSRLQAHLSKYLENKPLVVFELTLTVLESASLLLLLLKI